MTEDQLRRWVRGELPAAERREVTRWLVRCTSPDLGGLLHAMAVEHADERRDAALAARGGPWRHLVERWRELLDAGQAFVSAGTPSLVLASVGPGASRATLEIEAGTAGLQASFRLPIGLVGEVAIYVTDDDGSAVRLARGQASDVVIALPSDLGVRTVVWAVVVAALPTEADAAVELERAMKVPGAQVWAVRLSSAS